MHPFRRPEPVTPKRVHHVDRSTHPDEAASWLRDGDTLVVADLYGTGADILDALQAMLPLPPMSASYASRRAAIARYRSIAQRLLVSVVDHELRLHDARPIGFLAELYPEQRKFMIPFMAAQELYGAWTRYEEGIRMAVLGYAVHPFYGTYFPSRSSHLELFGTWLSGYDGARGRAIDVGTGCGVLSLMLCKAGFGHVDATDTNPNAVESVRREMARFEEPPPLVVRQGDLFADIEETADVIVFNPPWIPGQRAEGAWLDEALFYDDALFDRFFDQALDRLSDEGRIVLVFSNVLELVRPDAPHPIEEEIRRGRLTVASKLRRKVKAPGGRRTKERVEVWELART